VPELPRRSAFSRIVLAVVSLFADCGRIKGNPEVIWLAVPRNALVATEGLLIGQKNGLWDAVKPQTSPLHRFLIALHSPTARLETGLRMCPPEKS
jgi:hypothetical protein